MLKPSSCDFNDAYIPVSGTIRVPNSGIAANPSYRKKML